ncbi:diguanylate cyclase [Alkalihalobacillus sp. NPDC078783]
MKKYQLKLQEKIEITLDHWEAQHTVSYDELYRFLHSIAGTGSSIGLPQHSAEARVLLESLPADKEEWTYEEIVLYLKNTVLVEKKSNESVGLQADPSLVLIISEDGSYLAYLKNSLEEQGFMVTGAISVEKGNQFFNDQKPECVILVDPKKLAVHSTELHSLSQKMGSEIVPVIVLSEESSLDVQNEAYKQGITDYFVKPVHTTELSVRIQNRIKLRSIFERSLMYDDLTGVFNRRYLRLEGTRQLELFHRYDTIFSLVLLDLDFFKKINDTYGHLVGDDVLKGFADFLTSRKRVGDLVIRLGGEEFVLLLPNTNKYQAFQMVERFRIEFQELLFTSKEITFHVTVSAGISEVAKDISKIEELSDKADKALYAAKRAGRNKALIYNPSEAYEVEQLVTICIVDDNEVVRDVVEDELLKIVVQGSIFRILTFKNGEDFLESDWYQPRQKFLIVLDRMMPKVDGLEVLTHIRLNFPELDILVVMLTGKSNEVEIVQALNAGADDYIIKPFKPEELRARIQRLLQRTLL